MKINKDALVAGGVAGAAFIASAQHIWHVTNAAGNPAVIAALHPAAIDGLIYIGIRAIQRKQMVAGVFAVGYGAVYSLWFNAASYQAIDMPRLVLAACLPIALVAAVLIVHGRKHEEPAAQEPIIEIREVEVIKEIPVEIPCSLPHVPVRVVSTSQAALSNRPVSGGPSAAWDVDKVVDMLLKGEDVSGHVSPKNRQRVQRVLSGLANGAELDSLIKGDMSRKMATAIQAAYEKAMAE